MIRSLQPAKFPSSANRNETLRISRSNKPPRHCLAMRIFGAAKIHTNPRYRYSLSESDCTQSASRYLMLSRGSRTSVVNQLIRFAMGLGSLERFILCQIQSGQLCSEDKILLRVVNFSSPLEHHVRSSRLQLPVWTG